LWFSLIVSRPEEPGEYYLQHISSGGADAANGRT
jgi:hypothetical protein